MKRLQQLRAAWFVVVAKGQRPSRRLLQDACKLNFGSAFRTDEVAVFLRTWQYVGDDGLFHLRDSLGPVWVQSGSSLGPAAGPDTVLKNGDLGPVVKNKKTGLGPSCADLEGKIYIPKSANALSGPLPGPKRVRPTVEAVKFSDEDERRVSQLLRLVAAENKTNTISAGRLLVLRAEMFAELGQVGPERWRYGVDEANTRGRPWVYARAVMRKTLDVPSKIPTAPWQNGRRPGYSDKPPSPEKRALYAQLGTVVNVDAV